MRKMVSAPFIVSMIALAFVLLTPAGLATKPQYAHGRLDYCAHPVPPVPAKIAGNNVFLDTWEEGKWSGDIVGNSIDDPCRVVIHGTDTFPPTPPFDFRWYTGISTFATATVDGKTGGLVMHMVGKADFGEWWYGEWIILGGTGELAGICGRGTWSGPGAPGLNLWGYVNYEGWIHFEAA